MVQTTLILLNTIILSLDQYPIDHKLNDTVKKINFALALAFFIEAVLKISGLGWKGWFADRYNLCDAMVVVVNAVEMILSPPTFIHQQSSTAKTASFSGLRSFCLFALFKLARSWPSLQKLLTTMISTLQDVGNFSVLLLLFLYIYALIGMQTFANQFRFDEYGFPVDRNHETAYVPRANFDTMLCIKTSFLRVAPATQSSHRDVSSRREVDYRSSTEESRSRTRSRSNLTGTPRRREAVSPTSNIFNDQSATASVNRGSPLLKNRLGEHRSLFIIALDNPIRKAAMKLLLHPQFDNFSLALIIISTVELAIDNPLSSPDSKLTNILQRFDSVLTVLFMIEVLIKIIAYGFILHKGAYLRNSWNVMDFAIAAVAALFMFQGSSQFKFVKTLRTFRALRPLRMINRNPGLKLVVSSLIASIPQIVNVIMVCFCQGDVFDALTTDQQNFIVAPRAWSNLTTAEQNWFANSPADIVQMVFSSGERLTSRDMCKLLGATWTNTIPQNFDNVIHGIQTFFEMTTTEGWVTIMLTSIDATGIDMQPIPNHREQAVVKIIGLGKYYWKEPWNIFDFIVAIGSLFGVIYQMFGGSSVGAAASTVRSFRVGRLFRLVHSAPSLRQLFNTLLITLPSLANIGGLLFLVFFIYAAMGMQLFAKVKFGELVTSTANFQSLLKAMITLYEAFVNNWSKFDPDASGFLEWHLLPSFLTTLEPPMGLGTKLRPSSTEIQDFVAYLDVPIYRGNKMFFNDVARRIGKLVIDELLKRTKDDRELLVIKNAAVDLSSSTAKMNRGVTRLNPVSERSGRTSSNLPPANNTKESGLRRQSLTHEEQDSQEVHDPSKLIHDEKYGWSYFLQRNSVLRTYQKRLVFNNDIKVASLEFTIMFLSVAQLHWSYRSPFWDCLVAVGLELGLTAVFPYPGLETFFPNERGDTFVLLSAAVFIRPISWGQLLYYPYPIRQKEKVASFSGNLEFSYRQFVIKKVLDDNPLNKLVTFYTLLGGTVAYLLHVMETIKGDCWWENEGAEVVRSEDAICYELYASDSLWMVFMTFLSIGYGDVYPKTGRGRAMIALAACLAVMLDSMFFSIIIKKFTFSTMEARVHAFLYRMELYSKKDISAVMAVQATFRYNKSYKHSLIWHQERGSNIFYRPLSDRLPNEVKKKLYASRFQKSLKQIMKYNTDGDPLNAFSKHVEVITAALGATFVDMIWLKKMYYRKIRVLEQRRQQVNRRSSSFHMASSGRPMLVSSRTANSQPVYRPPLVPRKSDSTTVGMGPSIPNAVVQAPNFGPMEGSDAWGEEMLRKAEAAMVHLKKIESNMKGMCRTRSW
ncbi:hypothetical protein ON010_g5738 [Phytophthora cinnamomi]|nr:hypothetical protein ON010_g5738 [Phytophthora cinnamomi]